LEAQPTAKVSGSASQSNALHFSSLRPGPGATANPAASVIPSLFVEFVDIMFLSILMFSLFVLCFMLLE
jgi:hypothetical protein